MRMTPRYLESRTEVQSLLDDRLNPPCLTEQGPPGKAVDRKMRDSPHAWLVLVNRLVRRLTSSLMPLPTIGPWDTRAQPGRIQLGE
jgi:hypothetical protein